MPDVPIVFASDTALVWDCQRRQRGRTDMTDAAPKKKKLGIPTGNAGEFFVMGELLKQGYDAQLAGRNTKGYDLVVGQEEDNTLKKLQVKSVRVPPWYISMSDFSGDFLNRVTIYVLIGPEKSRKPVRYFIAKNADLAQHAHQPPAWKEKGNSQGFMNLKAVEQYEDCWKKVLG
jgi:hypothetical protein